VGSGPHYSFSSTALVKSAAYVAKVLPLAALRGGVLVRDKMPFQTYKGRVEGIEGVGILGSREHPDK